MKVQFLVEPHVGLVHDMPEDAAQKAIQQGRARAFDTPPVQPAAPPEPVTPSAAQTRRSWIHGGKKA